MEELGKHPFNYRLDQIRRFVNDLVKNGQKKHAIEVLETIKRRYLLGRATDEINCDRIPFYHLQSFHRADLGHIINGTTWGDGSKHRFIFELNQIKSSIESPETAKTSVESKNGKTTEFYALLHYYQRSTIGINEENKDEIGKGYGFKNGKRLFLDFKNHSDRHFRIEKPNTRTTLKNRIKLLERVQNELPNHLKKGKIDADLKTLRDRFDSSFL